jgi:hemerythrin-like domain-containing protein
MDIAEYVAAIDTLEQDHELVLDRMQTLKEILGCLMQPSGINAPQVFGRLRELSDFFSTQLTIHMDEEEKTLFPLLEKCSPEQSPVVKQLREEHEMFRRKMAEFESSLAVAQDLQDRPPAVVLRDLLIDASELWELLDKHAHTETKAVHACLNQQWSAGKDRDN